MNCSVCINTSDRPRGLNVVLQSLLYQQFDGKFEIVIVDDGTKKAHEVEENTKMFDALLNKGIDFKYIRNIQKSGSARSRNVAIKEAKYDLIIKMDDDHYCDSLFLNRILYPFENMSNVGCVGAIMPVPKYLDPHVLFVDNNFEMGEKKHIDQLCLYNSDVVYHKSKFLVGIMAFNRTTGIRFKDNFSVISHGVEVLFALEFLLNKYDNYVATDAICFHYQNRDTGGGCWVLPFDEATKLRNQDTIVFNKWLDDIPGARDLATKLGVSI